MSLISLLGLYNYNPLVMSELVLPAGVDRDTLIDNLLAETAELELIYSDGPFMQAMIGRWSTKEAVIWEKLLATTQFEYNPIENYNRHDDFRDYSNHSIDRSRVDKNTSSSEFDGKTTGSEERQVVNDTINSVSAYNELDFANKDRSTTDQGQTESAKQNSNSTTTAQSKSDVNEEESGANNSEHSGNSHGNIGVTTTQKMIEEERRVVKFNIYDYIINSFKNRFCLLVY